MPGAPTPPQKRLSCALGSMPVPQLTTIGTIPTGWVCFVLAGLKEISTRPTSLTNTDALKSTTPLSCAEKGSSDHTRKSLRSTVHHKGLWLHSPYGQGMRGGGGGANPPNHPHTHIRKHFLREK